MAYPPDVKKRIQELEAELSELKNTRIIIAPYSEVKPLYDLTGLYPSNFQNHISWLARAVTCKYTELVGPDKLKFSKIIPVAKMSFDEVEKASKCASEIIELLLKYAKEEFE